MFLVRAAIVKNWLRTFLFGEDLQLEGGVAVRKRIGQLAEQSVDQRSVVGGEDTHVIARLVAHLVPVLFADPQTHVDRLTAAKFNSNSTNFI